MESADWFCRQWRDCLSADCDAWPQSSAGGLSVVCGNGLAAVGDGSAGSVMGLFEGFREILWIAITAALLPV